MSGYANETLTLAIGEWAPYTSDVDQTGKLAKKIVAEAFKLSNIDVEYKYFPWKRSLESVRKGDYVGNLPLVQQ